jgi:hypothetical protein
VERRTRTVEWSSMTCPRDDVQNLFCNRASIFDRVPAGCSVPNFPAMSSIGRRACRNVQRWRLEAPRTKSRRRFPGSRQRLRESYDYMLRPCSPSQRRLTSIFGRDRFSMFNNERDSKPRIACSRFRLSGIELLITPDGQYERARKEAKEDCLFWAL